MAVKEEVVEVVEDGDLSVGWWGDGGIGHRVFKGMDDVAYPSHDEVHG